MAHEPRFAVAERFGRLLVARAQQRADGGILAPLVVKGAGREVPLPQVVWDPTDQRNAVAGQSRACRTIFRPSEFKSVKILV